MLWSTPSVVAPPERGEKGTPRSKWYSRSGCRFHRCSKRACNTRCTHAAPSYKTTTSGSSSSYRRGIHWTSSLLFFLDCLVWSCPRLCYTAAPLQHHRRVHTLRHHPVQPSFVSPKAWIILPRRIIRPRCNSQDFLPKHEILIVGAGDGRLTSLLH